VAHARSTQPAECCGLLIGLHLRIERIRRARNLASKPTRFLIDPADHIAAIHEARAEERQVVGVYHSHPATPPIPSPTDIAEASYSEYLHLIVSLRGDGAEARVYRLENGAFLEVRLCR
jgi:proteasome lid subunit RPN8/RPN11